MTKVQEIPQVIGSLSAGFIVFSQMAFSAVGSQGTVTPTGSFISGIGQHLRFTDADLANLSAPLVHAPQIKGSRIGQVNQVFDIAAYYCAYEPCPPAEFQGLTPFVLLPVNGPKWVDHRAKGEMYPPMQVRINAHLLSQSELAALRENLQVNVKLYFSYWTTGYPNPTAYLRLECGSKELPDSALYSESFWDILKPQPDKREATTLSLFTDVFNPQKCNDGDLVVTLYTTGFYEFQFGELNVEILTTSEQAS